MTSRPASSPIIAPGVLLPEVLAGTGDASGNIPSPVFDCGINEILDCKKKQPSIYILLCSTWTQTQNQFLKTRDEICKFCPSMFHEKFGHSWTRFEQSRFPSYISQNQLHKSTNVTRLIARNVFMNARIFHGTSKGKISTSILKQSGSKRAPNN